MRIPARIPPTTQRPPQPPKAPRPSTQRRQPTSKQGNGWQRANNQQQRPSGPAQNRPTQAPRHGWRHANSQQEKPPLQQGGWQHSSQQQQAANAPFSNIVNKKPVEELSAILPHSISSQPTNARTPNVSLADKFIQHFQASRGNVKQVLDKLQRLGERIKGRKKSPAELATQMLNTEMKDKKSFGNFVVRSAFADNNGKIFGHSYKEAPTDKVLQQYSRDSAPETEVKIDVKIEDGGNFRPGILSGIPDGLDINGLVMASNSTTSSFSFKKLPSLDALGNIQYEAKVVLKEEYTIGAGIGPSYGNVGARSEIKPKYATTTTLKQTVSQQQLDKHLENLTQGKLNFQDGVDGIKTSIETSFGVDIVALKSTNKTPPLTATSEDGHGGLSRYAAEGQGTISLKWKSKDGAPVEFSSNYKGQVGPSHQEFLETSDGDVANTNSEVMNSQSSSTASVVKGMPQSLDTIAVSHVLPLTKRSNFISTATNLHKPGLLSPQSPLFNTLKPYIRQAMNVGENYNVQRGAINIVLKAQLNEQGKAYLQRQYQNSQEQLAQAEKMLKDPEEYPQYVSYTPTGTETKQLNMGHRLPVPVLIHNYNSSVTFTRPINFNGLKINGYGNVIASSISTPTSGRSPSPGDNPPPENGHNPSPGQNPPLNNNTNPQTPPNPQDDRVSESQAWPHTLIPPDKQSEVPNPQNMLILAGINSNPPNGK